MAKISRRKFLGLGALALPAVLSADTRMTPRLRVTRFSLGEKPKCRFVHFCDFHYVGDSEYAEEVVTTINRLRPDFVCFTGDLVEDRAFLGEALAFIAKISAPVYGVPGNHDYTCGAAASEFEHGFGVTGGSWLTNRAALLPQFDLELIGMDVTGFPEINANAASRHLLMMHYPAMADHLAPRRYDFIIAGHSHGGQVRVPFVGPIILPAGVRPYDHGRYETPAGPMQVSAGIGTLAALPVRINCPPEVTLITI